jgi:hypothetical protein
VVELEAETAKIEDEVAAAKLSFGSCGTRFDQRQRVTVTSFNGVRRAEKPERA